MNRMSRLLGVLVLAMCTVAFLTASAQAAEAPVIASISPEHVPLGYDFDVEGEYHEVTITGENLSEATVTTPDAFSGLHEDAVEVTSDTPTSLVVQVFLKQAPGTEQLTVHTPGGTAATQLTFDIPSGSYPAIGRCAHVGTSGGGYKDKKCVHTVARLTGKYEWLSGLGTSIVTFTSGALSFGSLSCAGASGSGTLSGTSEVTGVVLTLTGCSATEVGSCSNTATEGEIETEPLLVDFAWYASSPTAKKKAVVGILPPEPEGPDALFDCAGKTSELYRGSITPVKPGSPGNSLSMVFATKKSEAKQYFIQWDGKGRSGGEQAELNIEGHLLPAKSSLSGTLTMTAPEPFLLNLAL